MNTLIRQYRKNREHLSFRFYLCVLFFPVFTLFFEIPCGYAQYLKDYRKTIFLEAEGFAEKGGWIVDNQFMDQLGSPVLLAHGFGQPVTDAQTQIKFPAVGEYRVYVRTRNWVSPWIPAEYVDTPAPPEYSPGRFQVTIGDNTLKTIFGNSSANWAWQQGESITIQEHQLQQEIPLILHDLTGFDGRIDAICLTADDGFIPPNDGESLVPLRREGLNIPDVIPDAREKQYDLVVVGGGLAGTCAAISAARLGSEVALIQNRPVLGGNGSTEVRVHLNGNINQDPYPNLGNLTYLMGPHAGGNAREAEHYKDTQRLELVQKEPNIDLYLNTQVNAVDVTEQEGQRIISAVYGENIETGQILRFKGKLFADCTGDANLGFLAGADWRMGRESKAETGESMAPEQADSMTMGASIQWNTVDTGHPTVFPELPWAIQFNPDTIKPSDHGDWDWETGLNDNQIDDIERIRDNGLRAAYGHWSYMKNKMTGEWAEKVKNRSFGWVSFLAGKRESRRLLGDVVLKEDDIVNQVEWEDASVTTTWSIDLHYPEPQNVQAFPGQEFRTICEQIEIHPYAIPYRCFYSRNVNNLFMAGRDISVTHVALGTIRVMRTGGMMGEVVGMAASVCKKHDCLPRAVYQNYLDELKVLMTSGVAEPTPAAKTRIRPKWLPAGEKNLAPEAKIEVSSYYPKVDYPAKFITDGQFDFNDNTGRWVSDKADVHWITFTFDGPTRLNALRVASGQAVGQTPIEDFVLQYEQNGTFVDIPETVVVGNTYSLIGLRFPETSAQTFRLFITATPGNLARIWEVELYDTDTR